MKHLVIFILLFAAAPALAAERPFPASHAPALSHGPWGDPGSTLETSKRLEPDSYDQASRFASIEETADRRSFVVWKAPQNFNPKTGITLVALHGHQGWATRDFVVWEKEMRRRGWAYLGIQWWYGRSAGSLGYAKPNDIYGWILESLKKHGVPPGRVIFEGYSMGSANSYAVTYADRLNPEPYFAATISNAGPLETNFPPNKAFLDTTDGFKDTHWVFFCGLRDEEQKNCCERMQAGADEITKRGGKIDLFLRDPDAGHGGMMRKDGNVDRVLDAAEESVR